MHIKIRRGSEADYPRLLELFAEFAAFEKLPELMVNTLERMISEAEYLHCFVAVVAGDQTPRGETIIGYATWFYTYFTWSGKGIYMDDLYVQPEYRGTGTGTRLLNAVRDHGKSSGCHLMRWQVSDWNTPAIGFYEKLGAVRDMVNRNCDLYL